MQQLPLDLGDEMGPLDIAIATYVQLRDRLRARKDLYDADVESIKRDMDKLEKVLYVYLYKQGLDNATSPHGTVYQTEKISVTVEDRDAFLDWVKANSMWHLLDARAGKGAVNDYLEEMKELPPGVKRSVFNTVGIRRSK